MKHISFLAVMVLAFVNVVAQPAPNTVLHFQSDKYMLDTAHIAVLEKLWTQMKGKRLSAIKITGHTDEIGDSIYNIRLSEKRVKSVADFFAAKTKFPVTIGYSGENEPVGDNNKDEGRKRNRRVEIVVTYEPTKQIISKDSTAITAILTEEKVMAPCNTRDTLIISPGGAEVFIPGCSVCAGMDMSDIKVEIKEALTPGQMRTTKSITRDANGNCLTSGGMVYITLTNRKTGKPITSLCDSGLTVRIPAPSPDPEMDFYSSKGKGKWNRNKEGRMDIEKRNGRSFYTFSGIRNFSGGTLGFNPDKIAMAGGAVAMAAGLPMTLIDEGLSKIKRKWQMGNYKTRKLKTSIAFISNDSSLLDGTYITRTIFTTDNCGCIPPEQQIITVYGTVKKRGKEKYYVFHGTASQLKVQRFWPLGRRYVIRKRDYTIVDNIAQVNVIISKPVVVAAR